MADMRVKMILDLVANTKGGAAQVKRELKGVKDAAQDLNRTEAGRKIKRDMLELAPASKRAAQGLRETKAAAAGIGADGSAAKLARDLDKARAAMAKLKAEARAMRGQLKSGMAGPQSKEAPGPRTGVMPGTRGLVGGYLGLQGARAAVRGTVGQSISFEKAMAEVKKKVDGMDDPAELARMEALINRSAITYGRKREEVAGLVAEAGAGGVSKGDMPEFMRINLAAATAWDVSADKAGNALAKIRAATQWTNPQLEEFADKVNALSDAGAAKEMDVVEMFQRAGAAAKAAGVEFDTSLAFLTAMNNVAIAPEVASRAFNAFASNLRTATEQPDRVEEGLKMLGLTPKGVEKGMKTNATATMIDVLEKLEKHGDKAKAAIKIFGKEWWDEVARAGQALPEIRKNLEIVNTESKWKGSAQNNLNIALATTDNHLERLKAQVSEVGDRLGRWALPPINEGIDKIIKGLDALDARNAAKERERAAKANEDGTADKIANGQPLSAEERERMAGDGAYRRRVQGAAADKRTDKANIGLNDGLRMPELQREREQLEASIAARRKAGATDDQLAYSISRLEGLLDEVRSIDPTKAPAKAATDPRRPADQEERGRADRGQAMALRERISQLESRLAAQEALARASGNAADKSGFGSDASSTSQRLARTRRELNGSIAPNATAAGNFGTGKGGAPKGAKGGPVAPGILSFGINGPKEAGEAWASQLRDSFDIDLGTAGMTMMEKLKGGISSGGAGAKATADGVSQGIKSAFDSTDLSAAGGAMMASLASGIRAATPQAVAAAQAAAGRVRQAAAAGGSVSGRAISGALHDGVV